MIQLIKGIFYVGPLLFAFGFIAPLTTQLIQLSNWTPPFGLTPLLTALLLGGALGLMAQIRGRWI